MEHELPKCSASPSNKKQKSSDEAGISELLSRALESNVMEYMDNLKTSKETNESAGFMITEDSIEHRVNCNIDVKKDGNGSRVSVASIEPHVQEASANMEENNTVTNEAIISTTFTRRRNRRTRNYRPRLLSQSSSSSSLVGEESSSRLRDRTATITPPGIETNTGSNVYNEDITADVTLSTSDSEVNSENTSTDNSDGEENVADEIEDADESDSLPSFLNNPKSNYSWNVTSELMYREHGLSSIGSYRSRNGFLGCFNSRFYSSRHVMERMKLLHCMKKHSGCVNCLNFNRSGNLICSGSDDTRIIIWDWAHNKPKVNYKSGHTENIFQTKFIESTNYFDIVSTSRDGQVRRAIIPPSGGKAETRALYKHNGAVHKLVINPQSPFEILSAGEDGNIKLFDIRKESVNNIAVVKTNKKKVRLFSIAHHPFDPEICVCGSDNFVRVYDKRNISEAVHQMCPQDFMNMNKTIQHVTCSVYNSTGNEILSSYSDDDIYLFNNKVYIPGHYSHRYRGHFNHKTIKGVNFFGPNSEYVISGSDCGHIFFWEKSTEAIINFMEGDSTGIVNCLEPHPTIPVLATSGLDSSIKIWSPTSETYPPDLLQLQSCVKRNLKRSVTEDANAFYDRHFYSFIRQLLRNSQTSHNESSEGSDLDLADLEAPSSSEEDEFAMTDGQNRMTRPLHCNPQ